MRERVQEGGRSRASVILMPRFTIVAYMRAPSAPATFSPGRGAESFPSITRVSSKRRSAASFSRVVCAAAVMTAARCRKCSAVCAAFSIAFAIFSLSLWTIFTARFTCTLRGVLRGVSPPPHKGRPAGEGVARGRWACTHAIAAMVRRA